MRERSKSLPNLRPSPTSHEDTPKRSESGELKRSLKGKSFEEQEALLSPQPKKTEAKPEDKPRGPSVGTKLTSKHGEVTVIATSDTSMTLKGELTDAPFEVPLDAPDYEAVKDAPKLVMGRPPAPKFVAKPPSGNLTAPSSTPKKFESKWDKLKSEMKLTDSEIAAMQAYTTSTYVLLNGYLRQGGKLGDDQRFNAIKWLVNTGVLNQVAAQDPAFGQLLDRLIDAELDKKVPLEDQWQIASPILDRFIELIVSGMEKWPQPDEKVVSRGTQMKSCPEFVRQMHEPGQVAVDPGFTSTTFSQPFSKDSIVIIKLPKKHAGRNIAQISKFEQEAEILFPPGASYSVERILERNKPGDAPEFEHIMKELVKSEEERTGRFGVVEKIYLGAMPEVK